MLLKLLAKRFITKLSQIRYRRSYRIRQTSHANKYSNIVLNYLNGLETDLLSKMRGKAYKSDDPVADLFDVFRNSTEGLITVSQEPLAKAMRSGSSLSAGQVNGIEMLDNDIANALFSRENRLRDIPLRVWNDLRFEIGEGLANNETTNEIAGRIEKFFEDAPYRAQRIARTEIGSAMSHATHETLKKNNIEYMVWLSSRDDRTRDTHLENDAAGPIPVGGTFPGTGEQYPNQKEINCRCALAGHIEV